VLSVWGAALGPCPAPGAAVATFEALELWDGAIACYSLLGKKALAEELVKRRWARPTGRGATGQWAGLGGRRTAHVRGRHEALVSARSLTALGGPHSFLITSSSFITSFFLSRSLAATPNEPKLWCALGDLRLDDRCGCARPAVAPTCRCPGGPTLRARGLQRAPSARAPCTRSCYREAWERSGHRHARCQRSLARSAMRRK
jgi:hypothetical protein